MPCVNGVLDVGYLFDGFHLLLIGLYDYSCFYTPFKRRDVLWNGPVRPSVRMSVRPSTIACECDILKTACGIDFRFLYDLNTTKTSDTNDLGHSMKTKMAPTAVYRLTLYPMQDIACEHDILKTACRIDFTF